MKPKNIYRKKSLKDKRSQKRNISKKYKSYKARKSSKKYISLSKSRLLYSKKKSKKQKYHKKQRNKNHSKKKNRGGEPLEDFYKVFNLTSWREEKTQAEENIRNKYKNYKSFLDDIEKTPPEQIKKYKAYYERNIRVNRCPQASEENCLSANEAEELQTILEKKAEEKPY